MNISRKLKRVWIWLISWCLCNLHGSQICWLYANWQSWLHSEVLWDINNNISGDIFAKKLVVKWTLWWVGGEWSVNHAVDAPLTVRLAYCSRWLPMLWQPSLRSWRHHLQLSRVWRWTWAPSTSCLLLWMSALSTYFHWLVCLVDWCNEEFIRLSLCPGILLTFLHASTSDFTYSLILTPGKFLHAFPTHASFPN